MPFKVSDTSIVILKGLPVLQCDRCPEYMIEDEVLRRVDDILAKVEGGTELRRVIVLQCNTHMSSRTAD